MITTVRLKNTTSHSSLFWGEGGGTGTLRIYPVSRLQVCDVVLSAVITEL